MHPELAIDKEIEVLSHIARYDRVRQRELSHAIGISLGMTNALLKRLVRRGYLIIRKVNNRNIAYAVTPAGVDAIAKRSYRFFMRTIRNIVRYRESIEYFIRDVKTRGYQGIAFSGMSDLDFLVEHACQTQGVRFLRDDAAIERAKIGSKELYLLYSESHIPNVQEKSKGSAIAFLQDVVGKEQGLVSAAEA
jgi:DNA-binding MarR family transcriptional regulator